VEIRVCLSSFTVFLLIQWCTSFRLWWSFENITCSFFFSVTSFKVLWLQSQIITNPQTPMRRWLSADTRQSLRSPTHLLPVYCIVAVLSKSLNSSHCNLYEFCEFRLLCSLYFLFYLLSKPSHIGLLYCCWYRTGMKFILQSIYLKLPLRRQIFQYV